MIHGKTKIELYNANTRIKKVVESENTFQSAVLARFMRSMGDVGNILFNNSTFNETTFWKSIIGGIFLFKNSIDIGTEYMPAGNQMIGNGCVDVTNNGEPTELGSYNSSESAATTSAITQVYDFTTSQANGNIGCVCLTSRDGGLIGYGNSSNQVFSGKIDMFRSQSPRYAFNTRQVVYGNNLYTFPESYDGSGTWTITKRKRYLQTGSVFADLADENIVLDMSGITETHFAGSWNLGEVYDVGNGKIRFIPWRNAWGYLSAGAGQPIYYLEFDAETETISQKSLINSSSESILYSDVISASHGGQFAGDYFSAAGKIFKISTGELIDNSAPISGGPAPNVSGWFQSLTDDLMYGYRGGVSYIYDGVSRVGRPINGNVDSNVGRSHSLGSLNTYKNPLYLATINNIQPVTKTAAQTMKVTYTLTEEE